MAQLHEGCVEALDVREGLVATGAADRLLRLWGADLRQAHMEARHEGTVTGRWPGRRDASSESGASEGAAAADRPVSPTGIAVSPDGQRVAVGTASGALCLLDIPSRRYTTLLRSHTATVHAVALLAHEPGLAQYCTAGADGTVRVWEGTTHEQVLELTAPGETVLRWVCGLGCESAELCRLV